MVPRVLRLHPKTRERLERERRDAERDGVYRVAKRIHAVLLNGQGYTSGRIAELLRAPRSKVSDWLASYQTYGFDAMLEGHRSGRPCELEENQRVALADIIDSGPVAYGLDSSVWTSPMIARVIAEEFAVRYHPGHVRKLLYAMGFSVQRPKRILARADPTAQDRWRRYTYPNLKKSPKRKAGANLYRRGQLPAGLHTACHVESDRLPPADSRHR